MKGGVTSGVVYPRAVAQLAREFRFKNIGGTSAGAIAASVTAAAELGRRRDPGGTSFDEVHGLPDWLKEDERVFRLFQPQPSTAPLFAIVAAATDAKRSGWFPVWRAALGGFWRWAVLGCVPGVLALLGAVGLAGSPLAALAPRGVAALVIVAALVSALLTLVAVPLAALAAGIALLAVRAVPDNFYGLCTGYLTRAADERGVPPLTTWLSILLDRIAGIGSASSPLTFGDLWGLDRAQRDAQGAARRAWEEAAAAREREAELREVNLELMTTCLSQGRPYSFPFEARTFYFRREEMAAFFPPGIVDWMVAHPRPTTSRDAEADEDARAAGCYPLPRPADLPVVVAARMSLSVPPLMSAVPLWAFDRSRTVGPGRPARPERCWFTDGGVTSNFPLHFFDSPLPRWPTFAINLKAAHPDHPVLTAKPAHRHRELRNVYMPSDNTGGRLESWRRWDGLLGFFAAIVHTMQNWQDNAQLGQPGFRDRIAHVSLAESEGGFNLRMPPDVIEALGTRGEFAGAMLKQRFTAPRDDPKTVLTWANHRWARYRAALAALDRYLQALRRGYEHPADPPYTWLVGRPADERPTSFLWENREQRDFAVAATDALVAEAARWADAPASFDDDENVPKPPNRLRAVPRL